MRAITLLFILFTCKSFAQQQLYTLNNGVYISESEFQRQVDSIKKVPYSSSLRAVIYHKTKKEDTVINYYTLAVLKGQTPAQVAASVFKVEFRQDSAFLLLDRKLPYFELKSVDGKVLTTNSLIGKPTLLGFWDVNCHSCKAEIPELVKLHMKYKNQVNFVAITASNDLSNYVKDTKTDFRVLENGERYHKTIKIGALPKYLFINKNGIVKSIQFNYPTNAKSQPLTFDDQSNHFVKLINSLSR